MPMTATILRERLKHNLKNDANFSDPTNLDTYLSLGQQRIVRDSPHTLGIKSGTLSIVATDTTATLATDFHKMRGIVNLTTGRRLQFVPESQFIDEVESMITVPTMEPGGYTFANYSISSNAWLIKFDTIVDDSYSLRYWYYWMPADISSTIVPPVSGIGFGELLLWAATMIARENFDPDGAMEAMKHYAQGIEEYRAHSPSGPDWVVSPPMPGYGGGSTVQLDPSRFPY